MNYDELGLRCGLEIHQRLDTKKLFCSCTTDQLEEKEILKIKRSIRSVTGETGEVDRAAYLESLKKNEFIYNVYEKESCLVDADCEPPHEVNKEALDIALTLCKMLKMNVPSEVCVMRKTVVDGSNTTGFQRTMQVGLGSDSSVIKTSSGPVRVKDLELEEESARIIEKKEGVSQYKLSGLGIPLIEIGTEPDIKTPKQALEAALAIGKILRLTGKVKRGIGSIRQDVNISIKNGARVEIKGFQDVRTLPTLIEFEALRQQTLIKLKNELKQIALVGPITVTPTFKNSNNKIIQSEINKGGIVLALIIKNGEGLFKTPLNSIKKLGSEIADYARAMGVKGMIHSDEDLQKYDLIDEFSKIRESNSDLALVIAGGETQVNNAMNLVKYRLGLLKKEVPKETRVANPDGTSTYARPLPGEARMYPETDVPPIRIDYKMLALIKLPESYESRLKKLQAKGVSNDIALKLALSNLLTTFYECIKMKNLKPSFIAETLISTPKEIKKRFGVDTSILDSDHFKQALKLINDNKLSRQGLITLLIELSKNPDLSALEVAEKNGLLIMNKEEVRKVVKDVIKEYADQLKQYNKDKLLMGLIMKRTKGRADGSLVSKILKEELKA